MPRPNILILEIRLLYTDPLIWRTIHWKRTWRCWIFMQRFKWRWVGNTHIIMNFLRMSDTRSRWLAFLVLKQRWIRSDRSALRRNKAFWCLSSCGAQDPLCEWYGRQMGTWCWSSRQCERRNYFKASDVSQWLWSLSAGGCAWYSGLPWIASCDRWKG